jgi:hypothetical protein
LASPQASSKDGDNSLTCCEPKWEDKALKLRSELGISDTYKPWTSTHKIRSFSATPRNLESLDVAWAARDVGERTLPWFVDLNPDISRKPYGNSLGALLQTSRVYDFARKTIISAPECLLLHGMPAEELVYPPGLTPRKLYAMVGESLHAPSVGTVILSIFLNSHAPWWNKSDKTCKL